MANFKLSKTFILLLILASLVIGLLILRLVSGQAIGPIPNPVKIFATPSPTPGSFSKTSPQATPEGPFSAEINDPEAAEKALLAKKPWLLKLPIKSPNYYVEYDYGPGQIKATLFTITSYSIPKEDQVTFLKDEVNSKLTGLGVDLTKEKVEWVVY